MSAILKSLNVHNFLIFQPILMTLVSKIMVYRALSDKTYLLLGLRSPLMYYYESKSGIKHNFQMINNGKAPQKHFLGDLAIFYGF